MRMIRTFTGVLTLTLALGWGLAAQAADRAALRQFLEVTGFDVAIIAMQQGAMSGPGVAGDAPGEFGTQYIALAERVFDPDLMLARAVEIMEAGMPDALVAHGVAFYGSELGKRLVTAENESQVTPDDERYAIGETLLETMVEDNPDRVEDYRLMMDAIGGVESSVRAVVEIQVRYLLSAIAAGSVDIDYSESELRTLVEQQTPEIRRNIAVYSMLGAAYAYRDISDDDVHAYREALEAPEMRQVYELLNAIQFEVMAERYEALATELAGLTPEQEI
jgi:hypothetical protein